jgi:hypothetical protein
MPLSFINTFIILDHKKVMIDSFYIGAYWTNRKEKLESIVNKTVSFLGELAISDEQFFDWYELGYSIKEALSKKGVVDIQHIESLYKKGIRKGDLDNDGYSKIGYSIGLWTGHKEENSSNLSINGGHASKFFPNCCVIEMPIEGEQKDRLLSISKQKVLFDIFIRCWNPDNVLLRSTMLESEIENDEIGWVSYYKSIGKAPKNDKIIHEQFHGGHLFYLTGSESYNYDLCKELKAIAKVID